MEPFDPTPFFRLVDVFGVLANGLLGGAIARKLGFDIVGFAVIAMVAGLGGGILRDLLLDVRPAALTDPAYLVTALLAGLTAYVFLLDTRWASAALTVMDLMAMGAWAATGASKSLSLGLDVVPAVLLGVVTAVGGGVIRDNLVGRVPVIFGGNPLYATLAIVGATEMVILQRLGHGAFGMATSILLCTVFGLLARRRGWLLPGALSWTPKSGTWRPWAIVGQRARARAKLQHPAGGRFGRED